MAFTVPTTEPERLAAGSSWQWTKDLSTFPASEGWTLSYVVTGPSTLRFAATVVDGRYSVSVLKANTAIPGGSYRWASYATKAGERFHVESGLFLVDEDLATISDGVASESFAVRTLRIVEAALEQRLPTGLEEYQIAGKSVRNIPMADLLKLRNKLRHEVAAERNGGSPQRMEVAFVPAR